MRLRPPAAGRKPIDTPIGGGFAASSRDQTSGECVCCVYSHSPLPPEKSSRNQELPVGVTAVLNRCDVINSFTLLGLCESISPEPVVAERLPISNTPGWASLGVVELLARRGKCMTAVLTRFVRDDSGQDLIEYGLLVGIITVGAITAIIAIGPKVATYFNNLNGKLP